MFIAEIHKKLSSKLFIDIERKEDILTSSFWGTVRYMSPNQLLKPLLHKAINRCCKNLDIDTIVSDVKYSFWKRLIYSEPDLLIEFNTQKNSVALIIEVKLNSGLSSEDQLKREWNDLTNIRADNKHLIFLTKDPVLPKEIFFYEKYLYQEEFYLDNTFWLSWYGVNDALSKITNTNIYDKIILEDLKSMLQMRDIKSFADWDIGFFNDVFSPGFTKDKYFANFEAFNTTFNNFYGGQQCQNKI